MMIRPGAEMHFQDLNQAIRSTPDADVMIVDEILAVGDIGFQNKCLNRFKDLIKNGMTLVFVSQNPEQVKEICSRAIWIDHGNIKMDGPAEEVCDAYSEHMLGPEEFARRKAKKRIM